MEKKGWKITAIIAIVAFLLLLIGVVAIFQIGNDMIIKEEKCQVLCSNMLESNSYYMNIGESNICYCLDGHDIIHQEHIE